MGGKVTPGGSVRPGGKGGSVRVGAGVGVRAPGVGVRVGAALRGGAVGEGVAEGEALALGLGQARFRLGSHAGGDPLSERASDGDLPGVAPLSIAPSRDQRFE